MDIKVMGQGGQTNLNVGQSGSIAAEGINIEKNTSEAEKKFTEKDVEQAVKKLNNFLKDDNTYAEYEVHEKFGDITIKIIDEKTKEVIMEVPSKKILDMIANLCEAVGIVFDKKA